MIDIIVLCYNWINIQNIIISELHHRMVVKNVIYGHNITNSMRHYGNKDVLF